MPEESGPEALPQLDEQQWEYLLHSDALMEQVIRYSARLEVLTTYYHDIAAALQRQPSAELRALQMATKARIREVTADAARVLMLLEQEATRAAPEAQRQRLIERLATVAPGLLNPHTS